MNLGADLAVVFPDARTVNTVRGSTDLPFAEVGALVCVSAGVALGAVGLFDARSINFLRRVPATAAHGEPRNGWAPRMTRGDENSVRARTNSRLAIL